MKTAMRWYFLALSLLSLLASTVSADDSAIKKELNKAYAEMAQNYRKGNPLSPGKYASKDYHLGVPENYKDAKNPVLYYDVNRSYTPEQKPKVDISFTLTKLTVQDKKAVAMVTAKNTQSWLENGKRTGVLLTWYYRDTWIHTSEGWRIDEEFLLSGAVKKTNGE